MRAAIARMKSRFASFRAATAGIAAVEFALVVPVLITLYFGTIEAGSLLTVDRRISTIAGTMGDLVSQWNGTITTATLTDYFKASEAIIAPYSPTGLTQVVSCIQILADGTTNVMWSRAYNGGTARVAGTPYPLAATTQTNLMARGGYLIVSETSYSYLPFFGVVFKSPINLRRENFFAPRFGTYIAVS